MLDELKLLSRECSTHVATSDKYREWQATLDMEAQRFVEVDAAKQEVDDRISLWTALRDWRLKVAGWISAPFDNIDTETITLEAEKYTKIVIRCEGGLPDSSSAVKQLRKEVFQFKEAMPIVIALGNRNLQPHHLKQIQQDILNVDIDMVK